MTFQVGGVDIHSGFPLDVTLLCLGLLATYIGLIRRHAKDSPSGTTVVTARQASLFGLGIAVFWLVDGWPMVALAEHLFSMHMSQHLIQAFVIPPLLLLGIPEWMGERFLRNDRVRRIATRAAAPVFAGLLFNGVLLALHAPQAIDLQLQNSLVHASAHLLMIAAGLLMWVNVVSPVPRLIPTLEPLKQMFYLFLMTLLPTIPSAFLIFGETSIYPVYAQATRPWNMDVAQDMQIGGLIMKLGGGFYLWTIIAIKYFRWAARTEREERLERAARVTRVAVPTPST